MILDSTEALLDNRLGWSKFVRRRDVEVGPIHRALALEAISATAALGGVFAVELGRRRDAWAPGRDADAQAVWT